MLLVLERMKRKHVIPISHKASFHQSALEIEWVETEQASYNLNILSTCPNPYYFARLSGPSLVAMKRMRHYQYSNGKRSPFENVAYREGENSIQYLGRTSSTGQHRQTLTVIEFFPVLHSGTYFLEILQLACNSTDESLVTNCLPNSLESLTLNEAYSIEHAATLNNMTGAISWVHEDESMALSEGIKTRIQPGNSSECNTCSNDWFQPYNVSWPELEQHPAGSNCVVCLVGASHSRHMSQAMNEAFRVKQPSCRAIHFDIKFPQEYVSIKNNVSTLIGSHKCTDVIVAMGQWALSWKNGKNFQSREDFKRHMVNMVDSFDVTYPNTRLTLRSLHYHPLSNIILQCSPTDWRSPMMTDAYNEMLTQIAESHQAFKATERFLYVDTSEVVRPVWDTPDDWSHYSMKVGIPEAIYLLNHIWAPRERIHLVNDSVTLGNSIHENNLAFSVVGISLALFYLARRRK